MILSLLLVAPAFAGERSFAWTYGADTVPKGGIELEHYVTAQTHGNPANTDWQHQIEFEYGISNRLELGVYAVAEQDGGGPLAFSAYKGRLRYRLAPMGVWPVDVAVYGEYIGYVGVNERKLEEKLIVSKDVGKLALALNVTGEQKFVPAAAPEIVIEPTVGVGYHFASWFSAGAEGKLEQVIGADGPLLWAGPNVHVAGEGGRFWWTVAAMYGLTPETRDDAEWQVRSLLAVNL
jgi:hypothetical protein